VPSCLLARTTSLLGRMAKQWDDALAWMCKQLDVYAENVVDELRTEEEVARKELSQMWDAEIENLDEVGDPAAIASVRTQKDKAIGDLIANYDERILSVALKMSPKKKQAKEYLECYASADWPKSQWQAMAEEWFDDVVVCMDPDELDPGADMVTTPHGHDYLQLPAPSGTSNGTAHSKDAAPSGLSNEAVIMLLIDDNKAWIV